MKTLVKENEELKKQLVAEELAKKNAVTLKDQELQAKTKTIEEKDQTISDLGEDIQNIQDLNKEFE